MSNEAETVREPITQWTAHRQNDNFAIICQETDICIGVEHNQTEARAIAQWFTSTKGNRHVVRANGRETVKAALALHPAVLRVPRREEILRDMGVI